MDLFGLRSRHRRPGSYWKTKTDCESVRIMTKKEWKRRKRRMIIAAISATIIVLAGITALVYIVMGELKKSTGNSVRDDSLYLSVNGVTRTGEKAPLIGIIYVQNSGFTGLSALELRNRYERADLVNPLLKNPLEKSAHYAVGVDGVCIEMIPLTEKAPGGDDRIIITYSPDADGNFTEAEEKALNDLIEDLMDEYSIGSENVIMG